jgi:hypothetical protein
LPVHAVPDSSGLLTSFVIFPGEVFSVIEEMERLDGMKYLRLADGRGWVCESRPGVGKVCKKTDSPTAGDFKQPAPPQHAPAPAPEVAAPREMTGLAPQLPTVPAHAQQFPAAPMPTGVPGGLAPVESYFVSPGAGSPAAQAQFSMPAPAAPGSVLAPPAAPPSPPTATLSAQALNAYAGSYAMPPTNATVSKLSTQAAFPLTHTYAEQPPPQPHVQSSPSDMQPRLVGTRVTVYR